MVTIESKSLASLSIELQKAHRAALPNTVRFTLNDLAFDVKKNTLIKALHSTPMHIKSDNLFKKYSGVAKATGWDIASMKSQAGLMPSGNASKTIARMEQQDEGGSLKRTAIGLDEARVGKKGSGRVKSNAQRSKLKFGGRPIAYGDKQGLIRSIIKSGIKSGGLGKGNAIIYGKFTYEIIGYKKYEANKIKLHLRKLYSVEQGRSVTVKPTRFTNKAGYETGQKTQQIFNSIAEKQLKKFAK